MYQDDRWEVKFSIYIFDLTQAGGSFFFDKKKWGLLDLYSLY